MDRFYDIHMHLMTLDHPSLVPFLTGRNETGQIVRSGMLSPSFILGGRNLKNGTLLRSLGNMLRCMTGPLDQILTLLEKDLRGEFSHRSKDTRYPSSPFWHDDHFWIRGKRFDRVVLCPLLIDFTEDPKELEELYYEAPVEDRIFRYADETLYAIHAYKKREGDKRLLDVLPFIGITPRVHDKEEVKRLLSFAGKDFAGVKVYPPLGFNPWPKEREELEKVEMVYDFCQEHDLPLITHSDDQGYRLVPYQSAWKWSRPIGWAQVLSHYPRLKVDFAHFGMTYAIQNHDLVAMREGGLFSLWSMELMKLMEEYPNVYGDLSYSGANPGFYQRLKVSLEKEEVPPYERILFGSDWALNLMKVESYSAYLEMFQQSPFSDGELFQFSQTNPERFLGVEQEKPDPEGSGSHA